MASNIRKDYFWNTLGSLVSGFVVFILTVFITRFDGVHASGDFGFAFSIAAIFSAIAYYGGRNYQVTDVKGEYRTRDYVRLRVLMSLIALVATVVFVLLNHFDAHIVLLVILLMGYRILDALSDVLYGILQVHDRLYLAGKSNLIKSIISIVGFMVVDYLTHNLVLASGVFIAVFILGIVLYDIRNIKAIHAVTRGALWGKEVSGMAVKLLPFALIMFLPTALNNLSKYFIQIWHPGDQGYFTILILPLFFLTLVISFVISPVLTRLARALKNGHNANFRKTIRGISTLTLLSGIVLLPVTYLLAPFVLRLVFGISFEHYRMQLTLIVASGIFYTLATVYSSVLVILRKIQVQLVLLVMLLLVNIVLSVILIHPFSIDGAIVVSMITNAVWLISFWSVYNVVIKKVGEARG